MSYNNRIYSLSLGGPDIWNKNAGRAVLLPKALGGGSVPWLSPLLAAAGIVLACASLFTVSSWGFCVSPLLFPMRTLVTGFGAPGYSGWSHLAIFNWITSAKTHFPDKITPTGLGSKDIGITFFFGANIQPCLLGFYRANRWHGFICNLKSGSWFIKNRNK